MKTINLLPGWKKPKYNFGDRVKQGIIVGLENYPVYSFFTKEYGESWRYTVLIDKSKEDVEHLREEDIEPLSPEELRSEIEAEIHFYKEIVANLKGELEDLQDVAA